MSTLIAKDLTLQFGGVRALDGVSLAIRESGIHAVIGPNGAGKTSLVNALTGVYRPTTGRVLLNGNDVTGQAAYRLARQGITRTFQNLQIFWTMSVLENVLAGFHLENKSGFLSGLLRTPSLVKREKKISEEALDLLGLVNLADKAAHPADSLSYGELKRLEIARALACRPKLLFLDEPVAGCTGPEKKALGEVMRRVAEKKATTIVLIEHDMRLVMSVSDIITVLVRGRVLIQDTPQVIASHPDVKEAYLGATPIGEEVSRAVAH